MYFNVSQLLRESSGSARRYEVDDPVVLQSTGEKCQVIGKVEMLKTDKGIWVSASLNTEIPCSCSRCLVDMNQQVQMEMGDEFLPEVDVFTGAKLHDPNDFDEYFYIDQNHMLDLSNAVNQYIEMNTPMNPKCSSDCAGICMSCGMNLNEFSCICDKVVRDPRWDALVELVSGSENKN